MNAVVDYAAAQIGKPYVWGQAGPAAFDCSGLTMMAWRAAGVNLAHYTVTQYLQTSHRPLAQAQPGDLVFWSLAGTPAPYHVAIYAGAGQIIEAPTAGVPVRQRNLAPHETGLLPTVGALPAAAGGQDYAASLSAEQLTNARTIVAVAKSDGLPVQAAADALMTAETESGLRNLGYGDRDSAGLFQQRPSQGWGSPEQVTDPVYATQSFLARLVKVPNWAKLKPWQAAQAVQVSAYADGSNYQQNWTPMSQLANQLYNSAGGATPIVPASTSSASPISSTSSAGLPGWLTVLSPAAGVLGSLGGAAAGSVAGEVSAFAANVGLKLLLVGAGAALVVAGVIHTTAPARQQAAGQLEQAAPLAAMA